MPVSEAGAADVGSHAVKQPGDNGRAQLPREGPQRSPGLKTAASKARLPPTLSRWQHCQTRRCCQARKARECWPQPAA